MTRARKLTLREFSHLVSESLDVASAVPSPQSFIDNTSLLSEFPPKNHISLSSFHRIFSRPTQGQHQDPPQGTSEDLPESPRRVAGWSIFRSPRKYRFNADEDSAAAANESDARRSGSPYAVPSLAASTSSFGSLLSAHERLFKVAASSSVTTTPPHELPSAADPLNVILGSTSATRAIARTIEPATDIASQRSSSHSSSGTTEVSHSAINSEFPSTDSDPTPRASAFGSRITLRHITVQDESLLARRGRPQHLSLVVPSRNKDLLVLRPAVGVAPHAPSESDSSVSVSSIASSTSPPAQASCPTFPIMTQSDSETSPPCVLPTQSTARIFVTTVPSVVSPSDRVPVTSIGFPSRQRKRAFSLSQTPPPLPRPPPTGPLPAVPSVPPVPPLPSKTTTSSRSLLSSPPRSTIAGLPANSTIAPPPSPPGGLRLPSRLGWVNTICAVLPSPPASPTKSLRSLAGRTPLPISMSRAEIKRPNELKRPTSVGVIEATDNVQVRRTKSILLLSSRSKSNGSLSTKRVQIHADVNTDVCTARKPRAKSSAATVDPPTSLSDFGLVAPSTPGTELLVPRERRHSAPVLSTLHSNVTGVCADWTLSLPFCTDVPGNKILPPPLLTPQSDPENKLEQVQGDDWTLCMPLNVRVSPLTVETAEKPDSECTVADTVETIEMSPNMQLPTPSPSPTWPTSPSITRSLHPEESMPSSSVERPASPASLGPHIGGLDLAGGRGKRASGWHVYGWFDQVSLPEDDDETVAPTTDGKPVKSHVAVFHKTHDLNGRHPSQDSMSTVSTSATFYSAQSSVWVN